MSSDKITATKPHYEILDGLRGVAALIVVIFHILEAYATSHLDMMMNHGYLAVDFFFVLSGFVIGYAYDDRWSKMSYWDFAKRRLIRLHPMVVMGMAVGAICFYYQESVLWPIIGEVPLGQMLLIMLIGMTLIPVPPSMDIRGWWEMHPLNGPAWTLFFEYVANILYAIVIRRLNVIQLAVLTVVSGLALLHLGLFGEAGDVIGGWSLDPNQLRIGFTRLMYPFCAGLLLYRTAKLTKFNNAFLWCSVFLTFVLVFPRIGGETHLWLNGLYDALIIILIFPLIVYLGASGEIKNKTAGKICKFLGDISYPIYITHYPIIYIYTAWVHNNKVDVLDGIPWGIVSFLASLLVAYGSLKLYDIPVRKWLGRKL